MVYVMPFDESCMCVTVLEVGADVRFKGAYQVLQGRQHGYQFGYTNGQQIDDLKNFMIDFVKHVNKIR